MLFDVKNAISPVGLLYAYQGGRKHFTQISVKNQPVATWHI
jgi:hypothetical protein